MAFVLSFGRHFPTKINYTDAHNKKGDQKIFDIFYDSYQLDTTQTRNFSASLLKVTK